jgi:membrane fusion protein (multidrug efflux system)
MLYPFHIPSFAIEDQPKVKLMDIRSGAIALVLLLPACGPSEAPPQAAPAAVEYQEVKPAAIALSSEFVARTRAREDTEIRPRITGNIVERNFEEGQSVEKDALLFKIDARPYQAALESAQADLENATSSLDVAEKNLARGKELSPQGYISQAELDKLGDERNRAEASLKSAKAALEKAQLDMEFTEIRAPFAGIVGRSNFSIGDLVDPSTGALVSLVQLDPMLVDFDIDEQTLAQAMKLNQERIAEGLEPVRYIPRLRLVTGDIYPFDGEIDYTNNRVNPSTGTITVTAKFPNPNGRLLPGQFGRILVQRGESQMRLIIPQPAVLEDMQGRYVFVVQDDDTVARRNVKLGPREGVDWVVEEGLQDGDRVVVNGIQKLRPGIEVNASPIEATAFNEDDED